MLTGHHYAANFTVADGRIAFTPLFLGASPQIVPEGRYTGWRILQHEADRALTLMAALKPDQVKQTLIADAVERHPCLGARPCAAPVAGWAGR